MALTESQIKVIIAAELQKAGFDKADKAAKNLTKSFQKLGATIGVALSARAFINFAKQGAIAFANEEKAVNQLTNSLANLGFAFSVPAVERYLEATEKATLVTKEELRPAIVDLISTTMSAQKGMKLLSVAVDAAAKTGMDLSQVTTAITKAYNGNYSGLAKLTKGYTAAELKAGGFNNAIEILTERVSGSAAAATDTYAFKIGQLEKAVGDAQKEIGKGLIAGLEQLGSGDYNEGLQDLVDFGTAIGKSFGYAAGAVNTLKQAYDLITLRPVRDLTSQLLGKSQQQKLGGTITPTQFELAKAAVEKRKEAVTRKKELAERKKLAALESAERRKREAALKKEQALKRAGSVFDMENIQIVAAMQNKVTDEQRLRLTALLAINTGNAEAAEKLSLAVLASNAAALKTIGVMVTSKDTIETIIQKIIKSQSELLLINLGITNIPKAKNPFEDWPDVIAAILAGIGKISTSISNIGKPTITPPTTTNPKTPQTPGGSADTGTRTVRTSKYVDTATCPSGQAYYDDTYVDGQLVSSTFVSCVILTNIVETPVGDGSMTITTPNGDVAVGQGTFTVGGANIISGFGTPLTANPFDTPNEAAARQDIADIFATIGTFGAGGLPTTNVIVNVAGNVTSEGDLTQNILDGLYEYQRRGQSITVSAIGL